MLARHCESINSRQTPSSRSALDSLVEFAKKYAKEHNVL